MDGIMNNQTLVYLIVLFVAVVGIFVMADVQRPSSITGRVIDLNIVRAGTSHTGGAVWPGSFNGNNGKTVTPSCADPDATYVSYDLSRSETIFDFDVEPDPATWSSLTATVLTTDAGVYPDECASADVVRERYCEFGAVKDKYLWCGYANNGLEEGVCVDGACVSSSRVPKQNFLSKLSIRKV